MENLTIREATAEDVAAVLHHRRAMFEEMGFTDSAALEAMQTAGAAYFAEGFRQGSYRGWLAVDSGLAIIGGGGVGIVPCPPRPEYPHPRRAMIYNVYVEPDFRRRGVARRLMEVMIEWCRQQGYPWVHLHASDFGRPLYEEMGFKAAPEMQLALD